MDEGVQREKLESQIRDEFGRILYTSTARYKQSDRLKQKDKIIKIVQICLSAITFSGILDIVLNLTPIPSVAIVIPSLFLIFIQIITWTTNHQLQAFQEYASAEKLWVVREEYKSLLTDFDSLSLSDIRDKRDILQSKTHEVNSNSSSIDNKSLKMARKSIKAQGDHSFSDDEINDLLPLGLRK